MSRYKCKLYVTSGSRHLHQLYTGLLLLDRSGAIELEVCFPGTAVTEESCAVTLNGSRLVFDMHDAGYLHRELLEGCDFYFKRSYCRTAAELSGFPERIYRYGLNYHVVPGFFTPLFSKIHRDSGGLKEEFKYLVKQLDRFNWVHFDPVVSLMQEQPVLPRQFRMLFLARVWDHEYDDDFEMTSTISADRLRINQVRADCIRALRKEFGDAFTGGLAHTEYASRHFPDCLAPFSGMTSKKSYIAQVKQHPVCVATTGLNQSIGWKFAEYVAFSRAILSETLAFEVPGPLSANQNYLEFMTVDECLEHACNLAQDPDRLFEIMRCNHEYYQNWLRPEILVWNCLSRAL